MLKPRGLKLKEDVRTAIAWGYRDNESTGYTQGEFIQLLSRAYNYIEFLENKLPEKDRYVEIWRDI
jgi:hypothetical protein